MKSLGLTFLLLLLLSGEITASAGGLTPGQSSSSKTAFKLNTDMNQMEPLSSEILDLVSTHREPRSWKTAYIIPGKVTAWYYECLDDNGGTITRKCLKLLKGYPDKRPLSESHPDLYIAINASQAMGNAVITAVVATVSHH